MHQQSYSSLLKLLIILPVWILSWGCATTAKKPQTVKHSISQSSPAKCPAPKVKGQPEFCQVGETLYVVGLAKGQGVSQGERMLLEGPLDDSGLTGAVGIVAVMESGPDFAKVYMLYQRPGSVIKRATARKILKDERVRLDKFIGRIVEKKGRRLRIDVGREDGVAEGDVYEVLSTRDYRPVGRLRIVTPEPLHSWAEPMDEDEPFVHGQEVTFLKDRSEWRQEIPVLIVVANFDPRDEKSKREAGAGRRMAKDLADAMASAVEDNDSVKVIYLPDERVYLGEGDKHGHEMARKLGKRHHAQIVVWGSMRCSEKAVAIPRYTVVDQNQFGQGSYQGGRIIVEDDGAGFEFKDTAPNEPVALAAAMLGNIAFDTQKYGDAVYYLNKAIFKEVLQGDDALRTLRRLAYAMHIKGQNVAARQVASRLVTRAEAQGSLYWQMSGRGGLAAIDYLEGDVASARKHYEAIADWANAQKERELYSYALNGLGLLEHQKGRLDEALKLFLKSLAIDQEIGAKSGEGTTLNNMAAIALARGDNETALSYLKQALAIQQEIGDKFGEGTTLHNMATPAYARGDNETALSYLKQSVVIRQEIGDKKGEGATLNNLSQIFMARGDYETALSYLKQSLAIKQEIGDNAGLCATLFNIGHIHLQNGEKDAAFAAWVKVYRIASDIQLAQALQALEKLAPEVGLEGGLEGWAALAASIDSNE